MSAQLQITYRSLDTLTPYTRNGRIHSKKQVKQIANSIKHFGFTNPVLIDQSGMIVAGHGRVAAAKTLAMNEVPTITLEDLSPDEIRAYILADNKLAENAQWDRSIVGIELQHLLPIETLNFDMTEIGFETPELDFFIGSESPSAAQQEQEIVPPLGTVAVTQPGDVWRLGRHQIVCGNALDEEAYKLVLGPRQVMFAIRL